MKIVLNDAPAVALMSCAFTGANAHTVAVTTAKSSDTAEDSDMDIPQNRAAE